MSVVSISIRHAATVILPWTIIDGYSEGCTFLQLYEGVKSDNFDLGSWSFPEKLQNAKVSVAILNLFYHLHVSCSSRIKKMPPSSVYQPVKRLKKSLPPSSFFEKNGLRTVKLILYGLIISTYK